MRAYLDELDLPEHDVQLDLARLRRLAVDAIAAMPDEELAAAAGAPVEVVPALRGARTLVEAREYARLVLAPGRVVLGEDARLTLERFAELRGAAPERLTLDEAQAIVRELKAVGGDLRSLRLALTGAERGPELAAVARRALARRGARRARRLTTIAAMRLYDTFTRWLRRAAAASRADPDVLLRPDGLPADPRRQRACRSSCRCG